MVRDKEKRARALFPESRAANEGRAIDLYRVAASPRLGRGSLPRRRSRTSPR
jgi:hypothetical protein